MLLFNLTLMCESREHQTEYGKHIKRKSSTPIVSKEAMYPESKQKRKEPIEAVMQRRREVYRKFYQRLEEERQKKHSFIRNYPQSVLTRCA